MLKQTVHFLTHLSNVNRKRIRKKRLVQVTASINYCQHHLILADESHANVLHFSPNAEDINRMLTHSELSRRDGALFAEKLAVKQMLSPDGEGKGEKGQRQTTPSRILVSLTLSENPVALNSANAAVAIPLLLVPPSRSSFFFHQIPRTEKFPNPPSLPKCVPK